MSDTSVIAILASVGIILAGTVTADAAALAGAVQRGDPLALEQFVQQYPESQLAPDALWLAAEVSKDRTEDSAQSDENPALTCGLTIARLTEGRALVTWEMTGATSAALKSLGFKKGVAIPAQGSKEVDFDGYLRIFLTARDAAGNEVKCSVILHSRDYVLDDVTGFSPPPTYIT
ncbi:MAG: hypothetical protein EOP22_14985 [Hyphomicrobiales bacterium]|nr:MAG: hypothetical protein EOP22_14985 [Hyphomicrobiales bacterium]